MYVGVHVYVLRMCRMGQIRISIIIGIIRYGMYVCTSYNTGGGVRICIPYFAYQKWIGIIRYDM